MKKQTLPISILILLIIISAGIWFAKKSTPKEWTVLDPEQKEATTTNEHKPFVPQFQLASELESYGYKFFPQLSYTSKEVSIYTYVRNNNPEWRVKEAILYILDGEDENRPLTTDRKVFDSLAIETSAYCSNPSCTNENPVVETNACKRKNDFEHAYVVNEWGNSETEDISGKIYAAWIIENSKFVPVSDLSSIECNYLED